MSETKFDKIKVGVVDLKSHNLFSIMQAVKNIGYKTSIISCPKELKKNDIVILPGVGSFKYAMKYLNKTGLRHELDNHTLHKKKLLFGICLGMQLLFSKSAEFGDTRGLNFLSGNVKKFKKDTVKVPHVGWNTIKNKNMKLFPEKLTKEKFYFIHSYYCVPRSNNEINTVTNYGKLKFCSSVIKDNIFGTQFHPEKSGIPGLKILKILKNLI